MTRYVFLDLETTGLDASEDQITEAAWITHDGVERQYFVKHTRTPHPWVLAKTDYLARIQPAEKTSLLLVLAQLASDCGRPSLVNQNPSSFLDKTYLVGANPAFDDRFLRIAYGGLTPYDFHLIDVETLVMGRYGLPHPPNLRDLRALVGLPGANAAPHTALADAREVKLVFDTLRAGVTA